MNKVILNGRFTKDPELRTQGEKNVSVVKFHLAVAKKFKRNGESDADFINCTAFGKEAEFICKYFKSGMKILVTGRLSTGSYTNKDNVKIYTTEVIIEEAEFEEKKESGTDTLENEFVPVNKDENLPFK